jgi:Dolichyl-phosphate-mannose-protein mannosyltransferase
VSRKDAVAVALAKATVSLLVLATGFRALSDDDFARIVIAERFARAPSFDPSGTSWLPFPFWLNGAVMALFGSSVEVARVTAFALGVLAICLVWLAATWLGLGRRAALAGAVIAATFPYSAWLGVATVPEAFTAALTLLGVASLSAGDTRRLWGALALALACLSRYGPWPIAATFALITALDAARARRPALFAGALLATLGALGWIGYGALHHHDAFFFVARVSAYRRAIGAGNLPLFRAVASFPAMIVRCEPEVVSGALLGIAALLATRQRGPFSRFARVALALAALVLFLIVGDVRDGAPTHHAERVLLPVWFALSLFAADALLSAAPELSARGRTGVGLAGAALVGLAALVVRPWYAARDSFIDRRAEVEIGRAARQAATASDRLLVDAPDFGYFAIIAGFGSPDRAEPVDDHDPRSPRPADAFASEGALVERVARARATLLATRGGHAALARALGPVLGEKGGLVLLRTSRN